MVQVHERRQKPVVYTDIDKRSIPIDTDQHRLVLLTFYFTRWILLINKNGSFTHTCDTSPLLFSFQSNFNLFKQMRFLKYILIILLFTLQLKLVWKHLFSPLFSYDLFSGLEEVTNCPGIFCCSFLQTLSVLRKFRRVFGLYQRLITWSHQRSIILIQLFNNQKFAIHISRICCEFAILLYVFVQFQFTFRQCVFYLNVNVLSTCV